MEIRDNEDTAIKLLQENVKLKKIIKEVKEYINKHCKNNKMSNQFGFDCYTLADTKELEHIMKILNKVK